MRDLSGFKVEGDKSAAIQSNLFFNDWKNKSRFITLIHLNRAIESWFKTTIHMNSNNESWFKTTIHLNEEIDARFKPTIYLNQANESRLNFSMDANRDLNRDLFF